MTQTELVAALQAATPRNWTTVFNLVVRHREACLRLVQETVGEMLDDPTITRRQLREELADVVTIVGEQGP